MDETKAAGAQEATEETHLLDTTTGDRDVDARAVVWFAVWLSIGTVTASAAVWGLSVWLKSQLVARDPKPAPMAWVAKEAPPGPRLQSDPNKEMADLRAEEANALSTYAWLSEDKTAARIPIERAMELVLANGLPAGSGTGPAGTPEERAREGAGGPPLASQVPPAAPGIRKKAR
jgi:hypothetical protein